MVTCLCGAPYSKDRNLLDAASSGACGCVRIVGYIVSNMLAFTSGLQFLNMTLTWFGSRVGVGELTVQVSLVVKTHVGTQSWL